MGNRCVFLGGERALPDLKAMDAHWRTLPHKHCASSAHPRRFSTLKKAQAACVVHASCAGVYDPACDSKGPFYMCKPAKFDASSRSCVRQPQAASPTPRPKSTPKPRPTPKFTSLPTAPNTHKPTHKLLAGPAAVLCVVKINGIKGWITYRAYVDLGPCPTCKNVFALAGTDKKHPLRLPPVWQFEKSGSSLASLGSNIGRPNPAYYEYDATLKFDSWVTLGEAKKPTSIGLDLSKWDEKRGILDTDGAIFFMSPAKDGPTRINGGTKDKTAFSNRYAVSSHTPRTAMTRRLMTCRNTTQFEFLVHEHNIII